jgi:cytochrome c oxidase subunit 3
VATGINTAILVSSGDTMHLGIMALRRDNRPWFLAMFAATIFLGLVFLYNQVVEYLELFHHGFNLDSGVYGAAFFSLTGVHGAHVTAGLAGLVAVFGRGLAGQFDSKRHLGVEGVAIYWHFVDVVWIFLFLVIYVRVI